MKAKLYLKWLKPYRKSLSVLIVLSLLTSLLQLPMPLVFQYMVDTVFPAKNLTVLGVCIGGLVMLISLGSGLGLLNRVLGIQTHQRFRTTLRRQMYSYVQNMSFSRYMQVMSGELTARLVTDLDQLKLLLPLGLAGFVRDLALTLGFIGVLFVLNWQMTLGLSVTIPFFVGVFVVSQNRLKRLSQVTLETHSAMQSGLHEKIEGLRDIQLTNSQDFQEKQATKMIQDSEQSASHLHVQQAKVEASMVVFHLVGTSVIWGLGGWMVVYGRMSVGELIGFSYAVNYIFGPFSAVFQYVSGLPFELAALARLMPFFDNAQPLDLNSPDVEMSDCRGHIRFENIGFGYSNHHALLQDINFEVAPGESLAILGASGVGKTTLISLLVKLLQPQHGRIFLDGQDIATLSDRCLRQVIGFVPQTVFLFQGTLKDNILMGRSVTDVCWEKVCRLSGVADLVQRLASGFETVIGEKGATLSGGERQRVAIARALLTDPQIIVLDEPSNNLDGEAKARLHQSLVLAKEGKTLLLVTHDVSLTQGVSKILKLKMPCAGNGDSVV